MTLTKAAIAEIIRNLIGRGNYRPGILAMVNADFLDIAMDFFKQVAIAKIEGQRINSDADWYRSMFAAPGMQSKNVATDAGLNIKTIGNIYGSERREVVFNASLNNYENVLALIDLIEQTQSRSGETVEILLKLQFSQVSVELTLSETLLVVNALAAKRAALWGGAWSAAGKRTEKPLMIALCLLFGVSEAHYRASPLKQKRGASFGREVDFYLIGKDGKKEYKCEVKMMGRGNPESADAPFARKSDVFVADKLSQSNKAHLDKEGKRWVELAADDGFMRFGKVLEALQIPHKPLSAPPPQERIEEAIAEALRR